MTEQLNRARLGTSVMFFLHGLIVSTWLSRIPAVQTKLGLTPGQLGLALLGTAIGAMIAMPLTGVFVTRLGSRPVTIWTTVFMCAALVPLGFAWGRLTLTAALVIFGASAGAMDISMNAQAVELEHRYGRPIMSSFHALFSLGGMSGAALGSVAAARGIMPWQQFVGGAVLYTVAALWSGTLLLGGDQGRPGQPVFARITRPLLGLGCLGFCILLNEGAMADWSSVYLRRALQTPESTAAAGYAVFSFAMAGGRLAGDRVTELLGRVRVVRLGGLVAAVGLAAGLLIRNVPATFLGFAAAGLGFSAIVPLVFGAAGRHGAASGSSAGAGLAAVNTVGYFGFLVGPATIGLTADHTGLRLALFIVVALSVIVSGLAGAVSLPAVASESRPEPVLQ